MAVLSIDLDHFKHVNDELGRAAGDDLLRQAAARLSAVGRSGDLLARYGGDEFVLLLGDLPDRPAETAALVAERALAAFADPFDVQGTEVACGVSVGVAVHPDHGGDAETLLRHADVALHAAKHGGRRTSVVFDGPARGRGLATLAARLRRAVARGELVLHWQPMFDLERDCISGVEGLVRWQDPQAGLLPPGAFIPQAESTGVIDEIGDWVVDEACRQLAAWRADGLDPRVGFNVAPRQLLRRDFAARVAAALARHGLVAPRLTMEITESAAMQHPERTIPLLHELRANGVHLAIDDFGAHHSSLTRLLELPVDVLKLDRAFLRGVPGDPRARAFVAAILGLTRGIGVRTVVEGVETPEQLAFLRAQGARLAQGYHLARPADTATITALLRARLPALRAA